MRGEGVFGIDFRLPGMKYAVFHKGPVFDAEVKSFNVDEIKSHPGVTHVFALKGAQRVLESQPPPPGLGIDDADIRQTARYWHDILNFSVSVPGAFSSPPGQSALWEFVEFRRTGQRRLEPRIQDPGNAAFIVLTNDMDTFVRQLRDSTETHILSLGRTYVPRFGDGGAMFFQEPNGVFLEACKGC